MSLIAQIKATQLLARKARENETAAVLTTLIGEAEAVGKKAQREVTDDEVIAVIKKFLKGMDETIQILSPDHPQVEFVQHEKSVLEAFLPKQLTLIQIQVTIDELKAENPALKMGDIMSYFKTTYPGLYDGKILSNLAKESLA